MVKRVLRLCFEVWVWLLVVAVAVAICCGAEGVSAIHPWRAVAVALAAALAAPLWRRTAASLGEDHADSAQQLHVALYRRGEMRDGPRPFRRAALVLDAGAGLVEVASARAAIDRLLARMEAEVASGGARTYRDALHRLAD